MVKQAGFKLDMTYGMLTFAKFVAFSILLRTRTVHSEVSFIIYSALSMPPYFLLYALW